MTKEIVNTVLQNAAVIVEDVVVSVGDVHHPSHHGHADHVHVHVAVGVVEHILIVVVLVILIVVVIVIIVVVVDIIHNVANYCGG